MRVTVTQTISRTEKGLRERFESQVKNFSVLTTIVYRSSQATGEFFLALLWLSMYKDFRAPSDPTEDAPVTEVLVIPSALNALNLDDLISKVRSVFANGTDRGILVLVNDDYELNLVVRQVVGLPEKFEPGLYSVVLDAALGEPTYVLDVIR